MKEFICYFLMLSCYHLHHDINEVRSFSTGLCRVNSGGSGSLVKVFKDDGNWYGYVLTAGHCIKADNGVELYNGINYTTSLHANVMEAQFHNINGNSQYDYGILKVRLDKPYLCTKVSDSKVKLGEEVYCLGNPNGIENWLGKGIISNIQYLYYGHDSCMWFGNSGGILMNKDMEQVAVNSKIAGSPKFRCCIPHIAWSQPVTTIFYDLGATKTKKYFGISLDKM